MACDNPYNQRTNLKKVCYSKVGHKLRITRSAQNFSAGSSTYIILVVLTHVVICINIIGILLSSISAVMPYTNVRLFRILEFTYRFLLFPIEICRACICT